VVAGAERYERLDDEARHTLRKRVKRLRYAVEFAQGAFDGRGVKRYLKPLRALQERLGAVNDVVMAMDTFRAARDTDPQAWFALGWLEARRVRLVDRAQPDLKAFAKAKRFWRR
jgi:CHAD domain-containing protein